MNPVIEAKGLRKTFGELVAVDDVSFSVRAGECFGILGPNGAGKTSTIRMIYGFSPLTAGRLTVFGLDITRNAREVKARIGVCQQENNLDPDLTVLQNLEVFARYFNIPESEASGRSRELLRFMALDHRENSRAADLSGGMLRRLVMARALLNRPELLILDEPTTGLDPQSRHQVWERLEELRAKGLSILMTTHYMEEASRLCDRLLIMDHGRILVEGKPADLILRHVGRHVLEVVDPEEGLAAFLRERGVPGERFGHRLIVYVEDGSDLYREISERFCSGGCSMRMATLEDVFLRLTGRELRE
ncbi:MAG: ABC transporter ATP-binding protein [Proteobacteria bacterium]|nr:ABC transporter ATP-binding protein [Pseudomonadota bacterium]MBU2260325.1 ABC transporter ATP-binding protein [Pseudomonadota bacterium]